MRLENASVVEVDQLVFSTAADRGDPGADQRLSAGVAQAARERRMVDFDRGDGTSDDVPAERDHGALDFWKFRHLR
jgi:hypothetical protein